MVNHSRRRGDWCRSLIETAELLDVPIELQDDVLLKFFGERPTPSRLDGLAAIGYTGKNLRYALYLDVTDEVVMISGDMSTPFGADSLFEIGIPCDSITEISDGYYHGNKGLGFWYGDRNQKHNMTMMLLKRPDGDLKVWPTCVFPERHPRFKMLCADIHGKPFDPP